MLIPVAKTFCRAYAAPAEDDQLRDLMQSLLLAQQSTNARLERLEDQTLLDEMEHANLSKIGSPDRLETDYQHQHGHRRNRSSRAILDIVSDGSASLLAEGTQRTSVLLNRKIYQEEDFRESQRRTWTSLGDQRQSFAQSNDLLQTWTDQIDPAPPYILSWHGEYAEDAYKLYALQESLKRDREPTGTDSHAQSSIYPSEPSTLNRQILHTGRDGLPGIQTVGATDPELPSTRTKQIAGLHGAITESSIETLHLDPAEVVPAAPAVEVSGGRKALETYLQTAYAVRRALILKKPVFVRALYDYVSDDDNILSFRQGDTIQVFSQLDSGWWSGFVNATSGWLPSNYCEAIREPEQMLYDDSENRERTESAELSAEGEGKEEEGPEVEKLISVTASPSMDSGRPFKQETMILELPRVPLSASDQHPVQKSEQLQESSSSVNIFKNFRVSIEDPCSNVLPLALRQYGIVGDWRDYALYIVYDDQERCVGLEERPLMLFRNLLTEHKKPMFMLRKLAAAPELEIHTKSPNSPHALRKNSSPTGETSAPTGSTEDDSNKVQHTLSENVAESDKTSTGMGENTTGVPAPENQAVANIVELSTLVSGPEHEPVPELSSDSPSTPVEQFKSLSFFVGINDPCSSVLPAAVRKYNIRADWRNYALWIVFGDTERCVRLEEKPLMLFRDLEREGKKPMYLLRKLKPVRVETAGETAGSPPLSSDEQ